MEVGQMKTAMTSSQLAIDGGTPVRREPFQGWPLWDEREEQALLRALRSGQWGTGGEETELFERSARVRTRWRQRCARWG
jgi:hypothetical protein